MQNPYAERNGQRIDGLPYDDLDQVTPVYERFPGWDEPLGGCRALHELPNNALRYITAIEDLMGCKAWLVSVGADRERTIIVTDPWPAQ